MADEPSHSSSGRRSRWIVRAQAVGLAVLSGLLILAGTPPTNLWPLGLVALVPLWVAVRGRSVAGTFGLGWLCGFVANVGGNRWGAGLLERFAGMSPAGALLAVAALSAYQAMVFGLWAGTVRFLQRRFGLSTMVTAPLTMALFEALIPFIFPWYLALCVWRAWPLCQLAELGGPPAVSALIVLVNLVAFHLGAWLMLRRRPKRSLAYAAAVAVLLVAVGGLRAIQVASARRDAPSLHVGLVQTNFGILSLERRQRNGQEYVDALRAATERAGAQGARLVVWPESMFPFLFDRGMKREYAKGHPWQLRGTYDGRLLAGVLAHPFGESYIYNSAVLFGEDGGVRGIYDKNALLVMGEYIPFRDWFPEWAAHMRAKLPDWPEIEPGREPEVLIDGKLRIGPLICYEDILPGYVHRMVRRGHPNLLVTLANHSWFGDSAAPRQAMALASFRAIETRRDLLRSTNTGVTSMTDALGRTSVDGGLYEVSPARPRPPDVFVHEARLLEIRALGPYSAPLFPYACATSLLVMIVITWRRQWHHESPSA